MVDEPAPSSCSQYFAPVPFPAVPPSVFFPCGLVVLPCGGLSYHLGSPPGFVAACSPACSTSPRRCYGGPPPAYQSWQIPEPALTATESDSSDSGSETESTGSTFSSASAIVVTEKEKEKYTSPPSTKLPNGQRKGVGYLYTGKPCSFHIIDGSNTKLKDLMHMHKPKKFSFRIFTAQDNLSIAELIEALGGEDWASVTQVWEWGEGRWKQGSCIGKGDEKAGRRLNELGWSEAGSGRRAPVWLYFKKK